MHLPLLKNLDTATKKLGIATTNGWSSLPAWAILPLRAFLGVTFVYAGLQKMTDPLFFNDASHGSLKYQLEIFSHSSPIRWLLVNLAIPHADLFGWLIALGELLVGLATLLGLFSRLMAGAGLFISGLLWLTATWSVSPYFLGPDSIYSMAWLTLLLTGMGDYSADRWREMRRQQDQERLISRQRQTPAAIQSPQQTPLPATLAGPLPNPREVKRRAVLRAMIAGGTVLATGLLAAAVAPPAAAAFEALRQKFRRLRGRGGDSENGKGGTPARNPTPLPGTPAGAIGNFSQVPLNGAFPFTLAATGDPGVVLQLSRGKYVAYDATCTHAGCTVGYDSTTQALICPCHGAAFDPANNGAVLAGPTSLPLTPIQLRVDSAGNMFVNS
jgi:thiosulfate dehydrogenase [quinone] large subunit